MNDRPTASDIATMLAGRAEALCRELLPAGKRVDPGPERRAVALLLLQPYPISKLICQRAPTIALDALAHDII